LVSWPSPLMGFLRVFRDAGLSMPSVQQADIMHAQVSNFFGSIVAAILNYDTRGTPQAVLRLLRSEDTSLSICSSSTVDEWLKAVGGGRQEVVERSATL
jgi:hypothetical protein